jgi:hypothetical protein
MNRERWLEDVFRPFLVASMVGCFALSLVELVRRFLPAWNGTYLVAACVLASLEASYSYRLVQGRRLSDTELVRFRAAELGLFFLLLKVGGYVGDRLADVWADVLSWGRQPLNIFDPETIVAFVLSVVCWWVSTVTARDLKRLGESPAHRRGEVPPAVCLTNRFLWGGLVLIVVAGLTQVGFAQMLDVDRPPLPGVVLNVLVYFLLGLTLLGQARFASLLRRWKAQEIKVARGLSRRWVRYSLAFVTLAMLLAILLPTRYNVGLFKMVEIAVMVASYLVALLYALLLAPLGWVVMRLFGSDVAPEPSPLPTPPPIEPSEPRASAGTLPGWLEVLRSFVFWAAMLGMVIYVLRSYLRDRPELLKALGAFSPIRALRRFLVALWRRLSGLAEIVNERIPRLSLRLARKPPEELFRFFRLGALSPRERILYYYLSILRRAGRRGFPGSPSAPGAAGDERAHPGLRGGTLQPSRLWSGAGQAHPRRVAARAGSAAGARAKWRR